MKLKDLQSAWSHYSDNDANRHQINETELKDMLKKRTLSLLERIDRNIKTGVIVFLALSLFFIVDDFVLSPSLPDGDKIPGWIILIDGLSMFFILSTFIYFSMSYSAVKKSYSQSNDLKHVLQSIIRILNTYRKLFYWALTVLLFVLCVSFVTGMFSGVEVAAFRQGVTIDDLDQGQLFYKIAWGILILIFMISLLFLFFRWGFRKLYGNYVSKLEETLRELEEMK